MPRLLQAGYLGVLLWFLPSSLPTNTWNKATMFHTFRQFGFIFAISIVSSLTVITLVSYVRDQRSCDDFDAPGVAFALTLDYG
jgi:hypothetical protein